MAPVVFLFQIIRSKMWKEEYEKKRTPKNEENKVNGQDEDEGQIQDENSQ